MFRPQYHLFIHLFAEAALDATLIFIGSGSLVCLMPLAIYLLYLSHINGRSVPTFISGPWDLGALLLGLSGFLLLLGPFVVTLIDSTWRTHAYGSWATLKGIGRREAILGSIMATAYYLWLLIGIPLLLRSRLAATAIYNVSAETVESAVIGLLEEHGYPWRRYGTQIEIGVRKAAEPPEPAARFFPHESASVRILSFVTMGNASLKWGGAWSEVRSEIEGQLPSVLAVHAGRRNPIAGWMFTAAMAVMIVMLLWLVVMIYLIMTPPPK